MTEVRTIGRPDITSQPKSQRDRSFTAAIVGGGISGLAAAAAFSTVGIRTVLIEKCLEFGGVWSRKHHFSVYPGLMQNTAAENMVFTGFPAPQPENGTNFTHRDYADYVTRVTEKLRSQTTMISGGEVKAVRQVGDQLEVTFERGGASEIITAEHVVVACGATDKPYCPSIPGASAFSGRAIHSSEVKDVAEFRGLDVLLIGFGNTAADLAVRLCSAARSVRIVTRNPTWVLPRSVCGRSTDLIASAAFAECGSDFAASIYDSLKSAGAYVFGDDGKKCIDYRTHRIVTCPSLIPLLQTSRVRLVPSIDRIEPNFVHLESGASESPDVLIYCTGYASSLPELPRNDSEALIANMRDPGIDGLWFIGFTPIWGSAAEIARLQSSVAAHAITGAVEREAFRLIAADAPHYETIGDVYPPGLSTVEFNSYARFLRHLYLAVVKAANAELKAPAIRSA